MLYTIKQYKVLFMNSIINKFEEGPNEPTDNMNSKEYKEALDAIDNNESIAIAAGNAIQDIILDSETQYLLNNPQEEVSTLTEEQIDTLSLAGLTDNQINQLKNANWEITIEWDYDNLIVRLNWEIVYQNNIFTYINNSGTFDGGQWNFGQASFPN